MKTTEEKAKEYSEKFNIYLEGMKVYPPIRDAFISGYNEAMRWRYPNIERPDYYKKVVVKYERDDLKIDHECVSLLADDDGAYFFGNYRFDIIIDFDKVIGWRPIE